jgi:membrane-associated phospholipid phosphatase
MMKETDIARLFLHVVTPFSMAAAVSVLFSWFSPLGTGPSLAPFWSAIAGIVMLSIGPFLPVAYSAITGRTDLDVSDVKKRWMLYPPGLVSYAAGAAIFLELNDKVMFVIALAYLCVGAATLMITLGWKISAHTAGVAGPTTALAFVFGVWILPLYVLSIVMVWARVKLGAHTLGQALVGVLVAVAVTTCVYSIFYL